MFANRESAGVLLARKLQTRSLHRTLVLAIPRGGVVVGAALARELGAELDVILARKLRAPWQPEVALGALAEDGAVLLNPDAMRPEVRKALDITAEYLEREKAVQQQVIAVRRQMYRAVRPEAAIADRTVIVTDDGLATGSTMLAALHAVRAKAPREVIVAVSVGSPDRLEEVAKHADHVECLLAPPDFHAVGAFYEDFTPVSDEETVRLLEDAHASV